MRGPSMKRALFTLALGALLSLGSAAPASAEFGLSEFDVTFTDSEGPGAGIVQQAGAHPYAMTTSLRFISESTGEGGEETEEAAKDIFLTQPKGFVGNPTAVPFCATSDFLTQADVDLPLPVSSCPDAAAVGTTATQLSSKGGSGPLFGAVYNLEPPPGVASKLGFWISGVPVTIEIGVSEEPPFNLLANVTNVSQVLEVLGSEVTLWGNPADPVHDPVRGHCLEPLEGKSAGECKAEISVIPFLTMPRSCEGPLRTDYAIDSWQNPGVFVKGFTESEAMTGCGKLAFGPEIDLSPTTTQAESASGLEIAIDVSDEGFENPDGEAGADIEAIRLALAPGITVNPSAAEGLGVCTLAQFQNASLNSGGCPGASKLGTIEADAPVLENHTLRGSFYLAAQKDNPFGSLLAAYLFIRDEELGIFMKLPTEIKTNQATGQIEAITRDLPPFPLERVRVRLSSGARAPLITPPTCGTHTSTATLTPSSGAAGLIEHSSFQISSGPGGAPCPAGDIPPFDPGFEAGSENNAAGSFSPFAMRLTRQDGSQDLTKFSAALPPGMLGSLRGVGKCPDAAIAGAKAKAGRAEQASPSCPASSKIGSVKAGAGVGSALTYVDGSLYLSGPYNGAPLSVVAIVPAVAGPFDVGTVVTRVALKLNPITAQVEVDGSRSDPIPHILEGIPLKARDIRVLTDRPKFTLNPTSCDEMQTQAQIFGSFADVFNPADDIALGRSARFQASSCASLGFKPKLAFKLKGGTKRGDHPAFQATYTPRPGDANAEGLVVRLPRSAFLDQAHIRTICTRVQFAADACPPAARYGKVKASTPLLDEALEGPVWLRSSNHNLPDLVFDLKGIVDIEVSARIDSLRGGIRSTLTDLPDAPITSFTLQMQGGRKGLIVNSRNLCSKPSKAGVQLSGHNGKASSTKPVLKPDCGGKRRAAKRGK